jgi:hypothetical protein
MRQKTQEGAVRASVSFTREDFSYTDEQRRTFADPTRSGFLGACIDLHRQLAPEAESAGQGVPEFVENLLELWRATQRRGPSGNAR